MKITFILMFAVILQTYASDVYSQKTYLTINATNSKITDVFDEIEQQSEFYFLYNEKLIDTDRLVTIEVKDQKIEDILDQLFAGREMKYTITDRKIIVAPSYLSENQQYGSVSGKVVEANGQPLPGVTVSIKGTGKGTVTDSEGKYFLANIPDNATLIFSFIGMRSQEVEVAGKTIVSVTMIEDAIELEETVAIGYGTLKKSDLTGSVASVRSNDIQTTKVLSPDQALSGRIAGVQVNQQSSSPGGGVSITIRGGNSVNGDNGPLYVIDGFPVTSNNETRSAGSSGYVSPNSLSSINPNDIESIEVLKDASATAIYGARGANGVILITTKKGKSGAQKLTFDAYYGVQEITNKLDVMNAEEFAIYANEAAQYNGVANYFSNPSALGKGTDWQDLIYTIAPIQNYQLGVSGGQGKSTYYVSGNYYNQDGIIKNSGYERYSLRTNVESELSDRIRIGVNLTASHSVNDQMVTEEGNGGATGVVRAALYYHPYIDVYNEDGTYTLMPENTEESLGSTYQVDNPVSLLNETTNKITGNRLLSNVYAQIDIFKGLTFRTSLGADVEEQLYEAYYSRETRTGMYLDGVATTSNKHYLSYLTENTLNYSRDINGGHHLNALVGFTRQKENVNSQYMYNSNFLDDELENNGIGNGTRDGGPTVSAAESQWQLSSWLGRLNYKYKDKYLVTMSLRADGSSRMGKNNRWGYFPSGALAWNVHNEEFLKSAEPIQYLKLRVSYGLTGNTNIGSYHSLAALSTNSYSFNDTKVTGYYLGSLPNGDLKWESTAQFDAGFDIGLFDGRLNLTADYYEKNTSDLLLEVTLPSSSGFSSALKNTGKVRNRGVELALGATILKAPFTWDTQINGSMNKNKVMDLGDSEPFFAGVDNVSTYVDEGHALGEFYGYKVDGIFKSQAEVDASVQSSAVPGDVRFVNVNEDEAIDSNDRTWIGNPYPDFIFGWNNTFSYKNFSLTAFVMGTVGNDVFNITDARRTSVSGPVDLNMSYERYKNRWSEDNPNGTQPRAGWTTGLTPIGLNIEDGSYVRLKTLQLGYNIPVKKMSVLKSAYVYVSGQNLLTITGYSGYNPDVNSVSSSNLVQGVDMGAYPLAKTYLFGVKVEF
ncbi:TonB-dependent receptor [Mangrovibacterium diazotrophicum]|uniref:TonB-linked SusC/RagA family outer membrane protein n=1 Tax=Mangrovibacterium diazotrophicum TaxID=1261403 RepID=A0A419VW88_9BACT|nr:TonB-dependent receptor [Mangrovibacterium diazotrophicum]RKD86371.1 TonB-linked SusC/RagA family outer membrane protein [Mangrovibacterium diazotrophicum]